MKIGCFSDAHICAGDPPEKDQVMYATLVRLLYKCDRVVVVGDFLEMYKRRGGRRRHFKKIAAAYPCTFDLIGRNAGKIIFVSGNHDDGCLCMLPGMDTVHKRYPPWLSEEIMIDGYFFFHGHQADIAFAHRTTEKISERIIKLVFRVEAWVARLTRFRLSEWFAEKQNRNKAGVDRLAAYSLRLLADRPYLSGAVCGHTHIIDRAHTPAGQAYINLGGYQYEDVWVLDTDTGNLEFLYW